MERLHEAFMESTIVQAGMAFMLTGTVCYMYVKQLDVPESLCLLLGAIAGFYFRSTAEAEVRKRIPTPKE